MTTIDSRQRPHSTREMLAVHRVFRRESALTLAAHTRIRA